MKIIWLHLYGIADGLYTKITGGQRVDLFGAQKADLPSIWKELVDAGFESGHAYGKLSWIIVNRLAQAQYLQERHCAR